MKEVLLGKSLEELQEVALSCGLKKFAGKQLAEWLYQRRATSFAEMTNISLAGRQALEERYAVGRTMPVAEAVSEDGTRKYLFEVQVTLPNGTQEKQFVESVYIPVVDPADDDEGVQKSLQGRATLCVSTQAGCKMGCRFCMTGTLGFHGQLSAGDILNQILYFPLTSDKPGATAVATNGELSPLTNLVYMGEGEPGDNVENVLRSLQLLTAPYGPAWSPRRITVSSVGVIPGLTRLLDESDCHIAISLHNPFAAERQAIMPIEGRYSLESVLTLLKQYDWSHQRRISFEYICFQNQNDTMRHANELRKQLRGLQCRVNLIRFHAGVNQPLQGSTPQQMQWLADYLNDCGITTTIRKSRGEDILAACGMLVNALKKE